jgi:cytosine/adenosine deaminase-related metal-dependent hydrolase
VVEIGPHDGLLQRFPTAEVIDARDCVITPAFVNAHHHMYGVLAHGIPLDEAPAGFWTFLEDFWWPLVEDQLNHELVTAATEWACLDMIRSGVTTFYDCLEAPFALPGALEVQADIVRKWGLRGVLSFEATERVSPENGALGLQENAAFIEACQSRDDLVSGMMCFHTSFTCSAEFIQRAQGLARQRDAKIHMHLSEGTYEPEYCLSHFGVRPAFYYDELGLLGDHVLASQCVQVDETEIDLLAQRGVHVSHQPLSNCEVGGGFAPVPEMLDAGINVALGTDGYINDFFEVMRAAALIPKARLQDPGVMPAETVWTMATQNGARALGFDGLGRLAAGAPADLLLIRADLPTPLAPDPSRDLDHHNLADQLLLWRDSRHLQGVMCAGKWRLWDGQVVGVDAKAVRAKAVEAAQELWRLITTH